jgi:hypothetical protein
MTDIQTMAKRLAELERTRAILQTYSHPDDLAAVIAQALHYVGGTTETQAVVALLTDGLDAVIAQQKRDMREALT